MTAKHVVDKIMDADEYLEIVTAAVPLGRQMQFRHPLSNEDEFIDFSYETDKQTNDKKLCFHFEREILYANDELDTVILKLQPDIKRYPPPLTNFTQPPKHESQGCFIGHSKREIKKTDKFQCIRPTPRQIAAAREWSMTRVNVDGFVGIDDARRVPLHCSFEKGASGSPEFIIDPNDRQAYVLLMLLCWYPDWYYDDKYKDERAGILPSDHIEQGVYMTSIYNDIKEKDPLLCHELFNFGDEDEEMAHLGDI